MLKDLQYAFRMLRRAPGFVAVAVATLGIAIGANTAIFSLIDGIFLHGLPFENAGDLVQVLGQAPERNLFQLPLSVTKFEYIRDHQSSFTAVGADFFSAFTLTGQGDPVQLNGFQATSNYFDLLGVKPIRGRLFQPDEEAYGAHVAIASQAFWQGRLQSDPGVIGRTLVLNGLPYTIVGVLPPQSLTYFGPVDLWTTRPEEFPGITPELKARGFSFLRVIARLKPNVTLDQAQADLARLTAGYKAENGNKADSTWAALPVNLEEATLGGQLRSTLWLLFGAVGFVLLIAASNVANLLLVRFSARRREIGVRLALGAHRGRVIRLCLVESLMVSVAAALVGIGLARLSIRLLLQLNAPLPLPSDVSLSWLVLAFTVGVALACGVVMGLYPAFQAARADVVEAVKEGGRGNTISRSQHWFRTILLGGQVALSCVLLAGAFLVLTSVAKLQRQDPGFHPDGVLVSGVALPAARYPDKGRQSVFVRNFLETMRSAPGISHAAFGVGVPLTGFNVQGPYSRADGKMIPYPQRPLGPMRFVSSDYFQTLGIPILAGRGFTDEDGPDSPTVTILSHSTATTLYPEGGALGRHLLIGSTNQGQDAAIVGIVGDVRSQTLAAPTPIEFYRALLQQPGNSGVYQLVVRADRGDPGATTPTVRAALARIDKDLPLTQPTPMTTVIGGATAGQRLLMTLLGIFAGIALLLAVVGIYSVVAYVVGQRTGEIGLRLALGAVPRDVIELVLRQSMTPVIAGLVCGIAGALVLGRGLASQLFGTTWFDPPTFAITAVSIFVAGLLACAIPSIRASGIAPATALRD